MNLFNGGFLTFAYYGFSLKGSADTLKSAYYFIGGMGKPLDGPVTGRYVTRLRQTATQHTEHDSKGTNGYQVYTRNSASELSGVSGDRHTHDKAYLSHRLDTTLMTWEELTNMIIDDKGSEEGALARNMIAKDNEEGRRRVYWCTGRVVIVDWKPLV